MEVDQQAAGNESLMRIAEDVHDVLVLNSSQRPGEECDVEPAPGRTDRLRHPEVDALRQLSRPRASRIANLIALRVDPEHVGRVVRVEEGEAAVAAPHLEHALPGDVNELANGVELEPIDLHAATLQNGDVTDPKRQRERA
jgi:hypothetical protein